MMSRHKREPEMERPQLHTTIEKTHEIWRIQCVGQLDVSTSTVLEDALRQIDSDANVVATLDLEGITFMDSTGLRCILKSLEQIEANGGRLIVTGMSTNVARVLEVTALLETLLDVTGFLEALSEGQDTPHSLSDSPSEASLPVGDDPAEA